MKWTIGTILFLLSCSLFSQAKYDYNWMLGIDIDLGMPGGNGILIDFSGVEVDIAAVEKDMNLTGANTTLSDGEGNLLFYTNGCYVADREHNPMENGSGLSPGDIHDEFCQNGYPSPFGVLGLPASGSDSIYYLFHNRYSEVSVSFSDHLYATKINMSENSGLGKVTEKNNIIIDDSLFVGYLTAVRHANDTDWWVMVGGFWPGQFHRVLLDGDGPQWAGFQDMGLGMEAGGWGVAHAGFSPDGRKYAHFNRNSQLLLYGFDRATGLMDVPLQLFVDDTIYFGGVAFSPDNRFLYVSNALELWQFDTEAADVQASMTLVGEYDGFQSPFPANFEFMQLAPDCRIYMTTGNGTDRLHVIDHPNRKGADCGFRQHAVVLPTDNFKTIPNMPNYRLGTGQPVCDSTIQLVTSTVRVRRPASEVQVWPNPASGQVTVELSLPPTAPAEWVLYDGLGRAVFRGKMAKGQTQQVFALEGLAPGLYFWEVKGEGMMLGSGKLMVGR